MSSLPWNWIIPIAIVALAIVVSLGLHMLRQVRRIRITKAQARLHPNAIEKPRGGARSKGAKSAPENEVSLINVAVEVTNQSPEPCQVQDFSCRVGDNFVVEPLGAQGEEPNEYIDPARPDESLTAGKHNAGRSSADPQWTMAKPLRLEEGENKEVQFACKVTPPIRTEETRVTVVARDAEGREYTASCVARA